MKYLIIVLLSSMCCLSACKKEAIDFNEDFSKNLIGKWDLENPASGSNMVFIYYVEHGIEFFENCRFNMRAKIGEEEITTYTDNLGQVFTWMVNEDQIHLTTKYGTPATINREFVLDYTLIEADVLELSFSAATWTLNKTE